MDCIAFSTPWVISLEEFGLTIRSRITPVEVEAAISSLLFGSRDPQVRIIRSATLTHQHLIVDTPPEIGH